MEENKKTFRIVLFYGGLWGITEATLGYVLHFLPTGFSGMIMFPVAFYFMFNSYKTSGNQGSIFYTAIIAASIKLTDLFIPFQPATSAINPAVSIILESLLVFAFIKVFKEQRVFIKSTTMSLSWILLLILIQAITKPVDGLYLNPLPELAGIIVVITTINGMLIGLYLKKSALPADLYSKLYFQKLSWISSTAVILAAVIFEVVNSLL